MRSVFRLDCELDIVFTSTRAGVSVVNNDLIRLREAELRIKNINKAFEVLQKAGFKTEERSKMTEQKTEQKTAAKPSEFRMKPSCFFAGALALLLFSGVVFLNDFVDQKIAASKEQDFSALEEQIADLKQSKEKLLDEKNRLHKAEDDLKKKVSELKTELQMKAARQELDAYIDAAMRRGPDRPQPTPQQFIPADPTGLREEFRRYNERYQPQLIQQPPY